MPGGPELGHAPPGCSARPDSRRATSSSSRSSSRPRPTASSSAAQNSTSRRPSWQSSSVSRRPASPESSRRMISSIRAQAISYVGAGSGGADLGHGLTSVGRRGGRTRPGYDRRAMEPRRRPVTSVDVARHAGVSQATVSLVLSGKSAGRVSATTEATVRRAAEELGYRPNLAARALRTGTARAVGLAVPDITHPFLGQVMRGTQMAARRGRLRGRPGRRGAGLGRGRPTPSRCCATARSTGSCCSASNRRGRGRPRGPHGLDRVRPGPAAHRAPRRGGRRPGGRRAPAGAWATAALGRAREHRGARRRSGVARTPGRRLAEAAGDPRRSRAPCRR